MQKNLMLLSSYQYDLPPELIAQTPSEKRDGSRMLVLGRESGEVSHHNFFDLPGFLRKGDCLVLNETRVMPARLFARSESHEGEIEVVLLNRSGDGEIWSCLTRPGKKTRPGTKLYFSEKLSGIVTEITEGGLRNIEFQAKGNFMEALEEAGTLPLPPYITEKLTDKTRYQTVYAAKDGSAAAPTAGLHFTPELLNNLEEAGIKIVKVMLHVGLGTFRPVRVNDLSKHKMHSEFMTVTEESAEAVNKTRAGGGRVVAVGTTSCRVLETAADDNGIIRPYKGETDIFIHPPYKFKAVDALITNFHLPESTLLMLVSAFCGYENTMNAYEEAVHERYRFFSFGDAMLII